MEPPVVGEPLAGRGRRWIAGDVALAGGLFALAVAFAGASDPPGVTINQTARGFDALAALLVALQALPLMFRQVAPAAVLAVTGVAFCTAVALGCPPSPANMCAFVAPYSAAKFVRPGRLPATAAVLAVLYLMLGLAGAFGPAHSLSPVEAVLGPLVLVVPWLVGLVQRGRWIRLQRLEEQARELEAEDARRRRAVAEERRRVARELHDIVGHAVTGMIVQAEAARVQPGTPPALDAQLAGIAGTGRQALDELRLVLDLMRRADWEPEGGSHDLPRTAQLPVLLENLRRTGQRVDLTTTGEVRELPAAVDASVYRIVQEALTNVVKHAGAVPVQVRLGYGDDLIEVLVENQARRRASSGPPGYGLLGMRERVQLFGGTFEAGRLPNGFRVRAVLPAPSAAARESGGTAVTAS